MNFRKLIFIAAPVLLLMACTDDSKHGKPMEPVKTKTIETQSIVKDSYLTPKQKSEKLARAGEELLLENPLAFMYADEVLDTALKLDANNLRAQFYKHFIAPQMSMKGIHTRLSGLAKNSKSATEDHDLILEDAKAELAQSSVDFITAGRPDINTEADVQALFDEIAKNFEGMRNFLKSNRDMALTLYLPATTAASEIGRNTESEQFWEMNKACVAERKENGDIKYRVCNAQEISERTIELADIEVLQNAYAAAQIGTILNNSYRIDGSIDLAVTQEKLGDNKMSTPAQYAYIAKTADFGLNRRNMGFAAIQDMGADAIKGIRYLIANQEALCKEKGQAKWWIAVATRPGKLFDEGLCASDTSKRLVAIEKALAGENVEKSYDSDFNFSRDTTVTLNPATFLTNQIQDIKTLKPEFNGCGSVIKISDDNLSGLFVNGGANDYIFSQQKTHCNRFYDWYNQNEDLFKHINN